MFLLANCFAKIHLCIEKQKLLTIIEVNLKRKNDGQNLKDTVGTTGCEISFGTIEPGQAAPFFHSHKQNEEIYIILSGAGDFQVNDTAFPIAEGSIVRVATACNRSIRCTSTEKMLYICIQAKEGSLEQCTMEDGEITQQKTKW